MFLIILFLASFTVLVFSAHEPPHKRQTFSITISFSAESPETTSAEAENPLADKVNQLCRPNIYKSADIDRDETETDAFFTSLKDSPFPCEQAAYIFTNCTIPSREAADTKGKVEIIEAERACLCPSKYWEVVAACTNCSAIHGLPKDFTDKNLAFNVALERLFCNTTVPEFTVYSMQDNLKYILPGYYPSTGSSDQFPSQTEVSVYYTEGVRPTTTDTWFTDSIFTGTSNSESTESSEEPFTRTSTFAASGSGGAGAAAATAAAAPGYEVGAAGGIVVAIVGAMVML